MPSDSEAAVAFSTERSELRAEGELFCERSERRADSSCTVSRLRS